MAEITRYASFAEETSFAEEAGGQKETLDPESAEFDPSEEDKIVYEGMSGLDRLAGLGMYMTEGSLSVPVDKYVAPFFFKWALGNYEVSGDTGAYTHTFSPSTAPTMPTFTSWIGKDILEHVFLGNAVSTIEIEVEDEWANMSVETVGVKDKRGTLQENVDFTEGKVYAAHEVSLSKGDTDITADVQSMTFSLETGASAEDGQGPGSRFPKKIYRGAMVVSLETTLGFTDPQELINFWGDSDGPSENTMEEAAYTIHLGEDIEITLPRVIYMSATQPVSGREFIEQTVSVRALIDTDAGNEGPVIVSVTNDKESYDVETINGTTSDGSTSA